MILYITHSTRKLLEETNISARWLDIKLTHKTQKPFYIPKINISRNKSEKQFHYNASKPIKYIGVSPTKKMKDFYNIVLQQ